MYSINPEVPSWIAEHWELQSENTYIALQYSRKQKLEHCVPFLTMSRLISFGDDKELESIAKYICRWYGRGATQYEYFAMAAKTMMVNPLIGFKEFCKLSTLLGQDGVETQIKACKDKLRITPVREWQ